MARLEWDFIVHSHCDNVEGEELTCMVCGEEDATGHVMVTSGPHDGRCLLLLCPACAQPERKAFLSTRLAQDVVADLLDITTGGPGADGEPEVWHRTHLDPLPQHNH